MDKLRTQELFIIFIVMAILAMIILPIVIETNKNTQEKQKASTTNNEISIQEVTTKDGITINCAIYNNNGITASIDCDWDHPKSR